MFSFFFFSSRRRHTSSLRDWSSDVCSSDLKLTIRPVQEKIPIFLAVLGPKNVALAGEIADGWLPVFFSPEHTTALRGPLEEGAARVGRSLDGFRVCPSVNVMI